MRTRILPANSTSIKLGARRILLGELVAFPTETVYGLGANAFDFASVKKIFIAKKRPRHDPLIVHVSSEQMLKTVVKRISPTAQLLIKKFWPGPLTLVLPKSNMISKIVTAGQDTVAVRMPSHPVAHKLIALAGVPIAAPSANIFGRPSPTTARHVFFDLNRKIPLILDGGSTTIGVESTILNLTPTPTILRPGGITFAQLKKYIPNLRENTQSNIRSPGLLAKHYQPITPVILFTGNKKKRRILEFLVSKRKKAKVMCLSDRAHFYGKTAAPLGNTVRLAARNLYTVMRALDTQKLDIILVEELSEQGIGCAIMNRLRRAATRIIKT